MENHDQPRAIDKFVLDKKNHNYYSKTMLAGMFFNLRGTPFIYQGEEIGMENLKEKALMNLMILEVMDNIKEL